MGNEELEQPRSGAPCFAIFNHPFIQHQLIKNEMAVAKIGSSQFQKPALVGPISEGGIELMRRRMSPPLFPREFPNGCEGGRGDNLVIGLHQIFALRQPMSGPLQGAGQKVSVIRGNAITKKAPTIPYAAVVKAVAANPRSPLYHSS